MSDTDAAAFRLLATMLTLCLVASFGSAAYAAPATPAPDWCGVAVSVYAIDDHPDEALFALWSDDKAGLASGSFVFYVGTKKYTVPFTDLVAASYLNTTHPPTPLIVRFDTATTIDSAYVATIDGAACQVHNPYVSRALQTGGYHGPPAARYAPNWAPIMRHLDEGVQPMTAPNPEPVDPPACATPYVNASTRVGAAARMPAGYAFDGDVVLMLAVRNDGSVAGIRVDKSSGIPAVNRAAAVAAALSVFNAPVYRCAPASGDFIFIVTFQGR